MPGMLQRKLNFKTIETAKHIPCLLSLLQNVFFVFFSVHFTLSKRNIKKHQADSVNPNPQMHQTSKGVPTQSEGASEPLGSKT